MKDRKYAVKIRFNQHKNRKNNTLVAGMYEMYLSGKSLAEVAAVYDRTRQAVYSVFRSRGYELRPKKMLPVVLIDGIKFSLSGKHRKIKLYRRTDKERSLLSHYIWQKHHGPMPYGWGVHHKDGNVLNDAIENLECLTIKEISSKHNPHLNQFTSPTGSRITRRIKLFEGERIKYAKN